MSDYEVTIADGEYAETDDWIIAYRTWPMWFGPESRHHALIFKEKDNGKVSELSE